MSTHTHRRSCDKRRAKKKHVRNSWLSLELLERVMRLRVGSAKREEEKTKTQVRNIVPARPPPAEHASQPRPPAATRRWTHETCSCRGVVISPPAATMWIFFIILAGSPSPDNLLLRTKKQQTNWPWKIIILVSAQRTVKKKGDFVCSQVTGLIERRVHLERHVEKRAIVSAHLPGSVRQIMRC